MSTSSSQPFNLPHSATQQALSSPMTIWDEDNLAQVTEINCVSSHLDEKQLNYTHSRSAE